MNYQSNVGRLTLGDSQAASMIDGSSKYFAGGNLHLDSGPTLDPAERLEFSRMPLGASMRFDRRPDDDLLHSMFSHSESMERERAAWEYADRRGEASLPILKDFATRDSDPRVRSAAFWLIQKIGGTKAEQLLGEGLKDDHIEVRDWAHLLLRELDGVGTYSGEKRPFAFDSSNPFDQTLPLLIAGHARVLIPNLGSVQATLSPQWFEAIMGRVMACTRVASFATNLVIEKRIKNFHSDGTNHYEIFKFLGLTQQIESNVFYHQYVGRTKHTFYPSGKVEDSSIAPIKSEGTDVQRIAMTVHIPNPSDASRPIVQSVRGRYMGFAYTNVDRVLANNMTIGAGEVQLVDPLNAAAGSMANVLLFGTFKGKLSDLQGNGCVDVNTERCHGTLSGQLDTDLDGCEDSDAFDHFRSTVNDRIP